MSTLWQDVRFALRTLRKNPLFTGITVLVLALAIGGNSAIFSVVNGVLLKPLPYRNPDRLVRVFGVWPKLENFPLSPADFLDFRARNQVFSDFALYARRDLDLTVDNRPEQLRGMAVSHGFLDLLGFSPILGRTLERREEMPGNDKVVVLSHSLWQRRFAGDPQVVGRKLLLSGSTYQVIGVMPPGIQHVGGDYHSLPHGENVDLWWPLTLEAGKASRGSHFLNGIARLKAGVTREQAEAAMNVISAQLGKQYPDSNSDQRIKLVPLQDDIVGASRRMLLVLLAAVGFVLLIACVNVANLLLARATGRRREIALRAALGASRWRLVRQLLTESLAVALMGGVAGLVLGIFGMRALVRWSAGELPRMQAVGIDVAMLAFTAGAAIATGLLFGLAPLLEALRIDLIGALKEGSRATAEGMRRSLGGVLVSAEIALALVLLVGAGLLMRSFVNLQRIDPGFRPDRVVTMGINLPRANYRDGAAVSRFFEALMARVESLHGVQSAGISTDVPWTGYDENTNFDIEGRPAAPNEDLMARYHGATPGYFRAIGTPLAAGRFFDSRDKAGTPPAVLINSALARRYLPGEDPVGKRLRLWGKSATIVGVVGDVKDTPSASQAVPALYWSLAQQQFGDVVLAIRTANDPMGVVEAVRRELAALDRDLPLAEIQTLDQIASDAVAGPRLTVWLVGLFASVAIVLAGVGIYGVMAYAVGRRMQEIGVRMALGAQKSDVLRMILWQGLRLTVAGLIAGVAIAVPLTRLLANLLFGVSATDPATFAAVAGLALAVSLAACYIPARRAIAVHPSVALRYE